MLYGSAGRIEIRNGRGALITFADVPFPSSGEFVVNSRQELVWRRERLHYLDCSATSTHLFALYSGRRDATTPDGTPIPGADDSRYIHVFGWDGKLVRVLELDVGLVSLAVDEAESTIMGIGAGSASLYRMRLPRIGTTALRTPGAR